jgi:hypothetical protein
MAGFCPEFLTRTICAAVALGLSLAGFSRAEDQGGLPPGVVITYRPASAGIYIGSPSLVALPDGSLVASHDRLAI